MAEFGASSLSVQKAMALLKQDGYAISRPGKGAFVAHPDADVTKTPDGGEHARRRDGGPRRGAGAGTGRDARTAHRPARPRRGPGSGRHHARPLTRRPWTARGWRVCVQIFSTRFKAGPARWRLARRRRPTRRRWQNPRPSGRRRSAVRQVPSGARLMPVGSKLWGKRCLPGADQGRSKLWARTPCSWRSKLSPATVLRPDRGHGVGQGSDPASIVGLAEGGGRRRAGAARCSRPTRRRHPRRATGRTHEPCRVPRLRSAAVRTRPRAVGTVRTPAARPPRDVAERPQPV